MSSENDSLQEKHEMDSTALSYLFSTKSCSDNGGGNIKDYCFILAKENLCLDSGIENLITS